ncbi:serine/arginine repetitive matrix protein 1 [Lingula anatina]|uniref:Serine/arginine repetitive matrix protein 1 n=1 Tax=Lingula anatina TaxID=7574 RepID=A0A1S3HTV5_LINAN|nr:serine/arginine repetitive matrix protein 1 [Lingula anatina]|eukprot:XP_013389472.1 serine/arginine repetitive matrix protein 1 [Lingula anatina]
MAAPSESFAKFLSNALPDVPKFSKDILSFGRHGAAGAEPAEPDANGFSIPRRPVKPKGGSNSQGTGSKPEVSTSSSPQATKKSQGAGKSQGLNKAQEPTNSVSAKATALPVSKSPRGSQRRQSSRGSAPSRRSPLPRIQEDVACTETPGAWSPGRHKRASSVGSEDVNVDNDLLSVPDHPPPVTRHPRVRSPYPSRSRHHSSGKPRRSGQSHGKTPNGPRSGRNSAVSPVNQEEPSGSGLDERQESYLRAPSPLEIAEAINELSSNLTSHSHAHSFPAGQKHGGPAYSVETESLKNPHGLKVNHKTHASGDELDAYTQGKATKSEHNHSHRREQKERENIKRQEEQLTKSGNHEKHGANQNSPDQIKRSPPKQRGKALEEHTAESKGSVEKKDFLRSPSARTGVDGDVDSYLTTPSPSRHNKTPGPIESSASASYSPGNNSSETEHRSSSSASDEQRQQKALGHSVTREEARPRDYRLSLAARQRKYSSSTSEDQSGSFDRPKSRPSRQSPKSKHRVVQSDATFYSSSPTQKTKKDHRKDIRPSSYDSSTHGYSRKEAHHLDASHDLDKEVEEYSDCPQSSSLYGKHSLNRPKSRAASAQGRVGSLSENDDETGNSLLVPEERDVRRNTWSNTEKMRDQQKPEKRPESAPHKPGLPARSVIYYQNRFITVPPKEVTKGGPATNGITKNEKTGVNPNQDISSKVVRPASEPPPLLQSPSSDLARRRSASRASQKGTRATKDSESDQNGLKNGQDANNVKQSDRASSPQKRRESQKRDHNIVAQYVPDPNDSEVSDAFYPPESGQRKSKYTRAFSEDIGCANRQAAGNNRDDDRNDGKFPDTRMRQIDRKSAPELTGDEYDSSDFELFSFEHYFRAATPLSRRHNKSVSAVEAGGADERDRLAREDFPASGGTQSAQHDEIVNINEAGRNDESIEELLLKQQGQGASTLQPNDNNSNNNNNSTISPEMALASNPKSDPRSDMDATSVSMDNLDDKREDSKDSVALKSHRKQNSTLQRIYKRLEDNRLEGKGGLDRNILNPGTDEYLLLKKILNIVFITVGLLLLLAVIGVIIYINVAKQK